MSNEAMREEYEETVRREFASIGKPEPDLRRNSTGDYIHATHAAAWWAWRASRAALAIEIPPKQSIISDRGLGYNCGRFQCIEAIKAAGVRVKS